MDVSTIVTALISVSALALGIANYVRAQRERTLNRELEAEKLIDDAYRMIASEPGGSFNPKDLRRRSDARALIDRAELIAPGSPTTVRWRGMIHQADGNLDEARRCFEETLQDPSRRYQGHMDLAQTYKDDEQIPHFEAAVQADPGRSAIPLHEIGAIHLSAGRREEALEYARRSLDANDAFAPAHDLMGRLCRRQGEAGEAKAHFERAIELDQNFIRPMVGLGAALMEESGATSQRDGLEWIKHAMKIKPRDDYPHTMLAAIYADRQEPESALEHYERAVELNPARKLESSESYEILAEMRKLLDETRSASAA